MNEPPRQAYDEQGRLIPGKGYTRSESFSGFLHAAAHVWIWRYTDNEPEVLIQKRSANKEAWPGAYDVSVGGHIDLGEDPIEAIVREMNEEIGLHADDKKLRFLASQRVHKATPTGLIENEFIWVYAYQLNAAVEFELQAEEVEAVAWWPLEKVKAEAFKENGEFMPNGAAYYDAVLGLLEQVIAESR